jgi:hypothetical protein
MTRYAVPAWKSGISDAVLAAFLAADANALRRELGLEVWQNTPLVGVPCSSDQHGEGFGRCFCNVVEMRGQIIEELEQRGGFAWSDLYDDPDDDKARLAWRALAHVAEAVGVPEERWAQILRNAGWKVVETDQQEDSDGE